MKLIEKLEKSHMTFKMAFCISLLFKSFKLVEIKLFFVQNPGENVKIFLVEIKAHGVVNLFWKIINNFDSIVEAIIHILIKSQYLSHFIALATNLLFSADSCISY